MRFALLNQFYPPDVAPTGQVLHDLARTLAARGHDVHALCSRRSYDPSIRPAGGLGAGGFPRRETLDAVHVHRVPATGFGRTGPAGRLADYATYLLLLARELAALPAPDLVLSLTTPPFLGLVGATAARLRHARHAHWVMDVYPDVMLAHGMSRARLLRGVSTAQYAASAALIALGPFMAKKLEAYAPRHRIHAVPLWGDASLSPLGGMNPLRSERGWRDEDFVLMYSGNMGLGHRFAEFFAAIDRLGARGPIWAFTGGGARRADVEAFARTHSRAQVLPYVPRARLRESLASADVHLASLDAAWQGLMVPSKIQGIFAVGRPVIFVGARDNEIARWIEEAGAGWIVPENDVDALLRAVEEARDRTERARRGAAAAEYARQNFDMKTNAGRIADVLEGCTGA